MPDEYSLDVYDPEQSGAGDEQDIESSESAAKKTPNKTKTPPRLSALQIFEQKNSDGAGAPQGNAVSTFGPAFVRLPSASQLLSTNTLESPLLSTPLANFEMRGASKPPEARELGTMMKNSASLPTDSHGRVQAHLAHAKSLTQPSDTSSHFSDLQARLPRLALPSPAPGAAPSDPLELDAALRKSVRLDLERMKHQKLE